MKTNQTTLLIALLFTGMSIFASDYYVSTSGNDKNPGTSSRPYATLQKAIEVVSAGDYIYLKGGTYKVSVSSIVITKSGTSSAKIRVFAVPGNTPVLSFDDKENSSSRGIVMDGNYWHWKGITIEKAGDNGMLLSGSNNTIEDCVFRKNHDTGLQLSRYNTNADNISKWPSNNLVLNCESYDNADSDAEDADGFAAKLTCGTGNVFRGCVAHHNIDDGWDLYSKSATGAIGVVIFEDCIAHNNGTLTDGKTSGGGDKNGFKLGSSAHKINHELRRCIAYKNGKHGFTDNGNVGNIKFYNLTAYKNGDYNFHTRDNASHTFRNCISFDGNKTDRIVGDAPKSCNALTETDIDWTMSASSSDFQTMTPGPNSDPTSNGFLNLKSSSPLINAGCSANGVSGNGTLDLGAIEYGGAVNATTYSLSTSVSGSGSVSGGGTYNKGTTATVTTTPASGWSFSYWSGDASGTSTTAKVYMDGNKSVTAVFVKDASDGGDDGGTGGDIIHNFTESGKTSDFFNISGNLSNSKGTVTYNGQNLTQCLKIESSTSITFTSAQKGTLTLVFNNSFNGGIKIDGASLDASSGILTTTLAAGSHNITKDNVANLYYISLSNNGTATGAATYTLNESVSGSGFKNAAGSPNFALAGWATENGGTTGGTGGTTVYASTGDQILDYIDKKKDGAYSNGLIIIVNGTITPDNTSATKIDIKEVKGVSLIGKGTKGEFDGIGIKVYRSSNIIIRNIKVHHVLTGDKDCITIEGPADHVWVDHCELYNEYDGVKKDYYDALLDVKRNAEYVTYSWNYLHDSWKTSLVGSSESDTYDRKITMHHNYYRNCSSRLPLFRGGNGHIFNNYWVDIHSTGINSRLGACIKIEGNYFENVMNPIVSAYSDELGSGELKDNTFVDCTWDFSRNDVHEIGSCKANVPYKYSGVLNSSATVKDMVKQFAGVGKLTDPTSFSTVKSTGESITASQTHAIDNLAAYPNPFGSSTTIQFNLNSKQNLSFTLYDMTGRVVDERPHDYYSAGNNVITYNNPGLKAGIYTLSIKNSATLKNIRLVIK